MGMNDNNDSRGGKRRTIMWELCFEARNESDTRNPLNIGLSEVIFKQTFKKPNILMFDVKVTQL